MDELDPLQARLDIGEIQVFFRQLEALFELEQGSGELEIGVGKGLVVALGMPSGDAGHACGCGVEVGVPPGEHLDRLVELAHDEVVGIFLAPFDGALGTEDAHGQAVIIANRHLGAPVAAHRAVLVLD